MVKFSSQKLWNLPEKELLELINSETLVRKPRKIRFYVPSFIPYTTRYYTGIKDCFPTISVTGNYCALNCKHCGGKILKTMYSAATPEKLYSLCIELKRNNAKGCLISGGCRPDGSVPLESFMEVIKKVKRELELKVFVHTGIIDSKTAMQLKSVGVDSVLIDIIGSDRTLQQIYNLDLKTADYQYSLKVLDDTNLNFVPHIIVGLQKGKLEGEYTALNMATQHKSSAVVIIAFMPIHGTAMAKIIPPAPIDIARVVAVARALSPTTPLALGCMRPKGKHRQQTDLLTLKAGIDAIAYPTETTIEYAQNNNYEITFSPLCCAQIHEDLKNA